MKNQARYLLILTLAVCHVIINGCHPQKCPQPNVEKTQENTGGTGTASGSNTGKNLKTLTLQPNTEEGKDAMIFYISSQTTNHGNTNIKNYGTEIGFVAMESTFSGNPGKECSLIQFDLSPIPQNSKISSALLSLSACPDCSQYIGGQYGHYSNAGNEGLLQRITSPWEEKTVTWDTRPSVTTDNQITIHSSLFGGENYPDIDVTPLVQDMVNNPATSHGFYFSMKNSTYYRSMIFVSSDHTDSTKHPKLVISYE